MKRKLLISLLVGMMGVIIIGCGDDMYVYTPNDNLYKYCAFDSSSYWIYEDSATHQIDSVIAIQRLEKLEDITNRRREWYHGKLFTFYQVYKIINSDTTIIQQFQPIVGFAKPDDSGTSLNADELYTIVPSYQDNLYYYEQYQLPRLNWYYMNISIPSANEYHFVDKEMPGSCTFKYSEHYDNVTINNHIYQDVKKIEFYLYEDAVYSIISYWANGIGMVRREYHSSDSIVQVKNLIRYNVINVTNQYQ